MSWSEFLSVMSIAVIILGAFWFIATMLPKDVDAMYEEVLDEVEKDALARKQSEGDSNDVE